MATWKRLVCTRRSLVDSLLAVTTCQTRLTLRAELRNYGTRQESKQWKQKPNRNPKLSIILTQDVHKLGVKGQIVQVNHGYGRNHLIPQKKAVYATHYNVMDLKAFKEVEKGVSGVNEVDFLANYLSSRQLTVRCPPGDITPIFEQHISKAFRQRLQLHVPVDCIELTDPITDFQSEHSIQVRLDESTLVTIPVKVDIALTKKEQRKLEKKTRALKRNAELDG